MKIINWLSLALLCSYSISSLAKSTDFNHKSQIEDPRAFHEVEVEPGVTKIIAGSIRDLNAIYTPFENPAIVKNSDLQVTILNNVIYFQPESNVPFGLYITEKDDEKAPIYKLTVVPSKIPVGQQIKLKPKNLSYFNGKQLNQLAKEAPDYPSFLISLLADTAKSGNPSSFSKDLSYDKPPFFIGNVLISPSYRAISSNYEILVLEATNRDNNTVQLTESSFAYLQPETGLTKGSEPEKVAAVGLFPKIVLAPGATTMVYLVKVRHD